jgi:hypothetical protein
VPESSAQVETSHTSGNERAVLEIAVARAQALVDGQFRDNDALDAKAFGMLGANAAAIGVLVAAHHDINSFWWLPAGALGVSAVLLMAIVWPRRFDTGPDPTSL